MPNLFLHNDNDHIITRRRLIIVLTLGTFFGLGFLLSVHQTSFGQLISNNATNTTSISSNDPSILHLNSSSFGLSNNSTADLVFLTKICSAMSNPCNGTDQDDNMTGDEGPNLMYGLRGDDIMSARGDDDEMYGGSGVDNMSGGAGKDLMYGNLFKDIMNGGDGNDNMHGDEGVFNFGGSDIMNGQGGNDTMQGDWGNDNMTGGVGDDIMYGWQGDNRMDGEEGDDLMLGGGEYDNITGGVGEDYIVGYEGNDTLIGGPNRDQIYHSSDSAVIAVRTDPDGSRDLIDCGGGKYDEVWMNVPIDHDIQIGCEIIHGDTLPDFDKDGFNNWVDNCVFDYNPDQTDIDLDGIGDLCDPGLFTSDHNGGVER